MRRFMAVVTVLSLVAAQAPAWAQIAAPAREAAPAVQPKRELFARLSEGDVTRDRFADEETSDRLRRSFRHDGASMDDGESWRGHSHGGGHKLLWVLGGAVIGGGIATGAFLLARDSHHRHHGEMMPGQGAFGGH